MVMMAAALAMAHIEPVNAQKFTVPGTADPWLADGGTDDYNPGNGNLDTTPAESPVFFGAVSAGTTLNWNATGSTGNTPTVSSYGPNGGPETTYIATPSNPIFASLPSFSAPFSSLIEVFTGPGYGDVFEMGSSGNVVVPVGATDFYLGNMDSCQWNNNSGAFNVTVGGAGWRHDVWPHGKRAGCFARISSQTVLLEHSLSLFSIGRAERLCLFY